MEDIEAGLDVQHWRREFPIVDTCTYLVSHSLGAMPRKASEYLRQFADEWSGRGVRAWYEGWWEIGRETGNILAPILGVAKNTISMHQNVTVAQGIIASCFTYDGPRRKIVMTELEFPSNHYLYEGFSRYGAEITYVPCSDPVRLDLQQFLDAIDERTLLVPISHVLFKNGEIQDVEPIVRRAHEAGAYVVLDCYQSAGVVSFDLTELGVDFAVGGSVKWLCGGPGAGWLYVRPDVAERLEPTLVGWQGHARPFAFEPELEYAEGARRFLTGTPNVPALYAATAGYDVIEDVGVPAIRERSLALTQLMIDLCDEAGLEIVSPREAKRRAGTVTVSTPDHAACHAELGARGILCDFRPDPSGGVRIGPHFFNTEDEVRHAISELADI
ncbi:MAG TPA: aminotransferase class V-fold PLP-dependent enzyme, partial [Vicinamibacterales bacterium]